MANEQNLKKGKKTQFSGERAAKEGRKGGIATGAKKRQMRTLAEELRVLLQEDIVDKRGMKMNTQTAISTALIKAALSGEVKAFNAIRDTLGQKPTDKVETNISLKTRWENAATKAKGH